MLHWVGIAIVVLVGGYLLFNNPTTVTENITSPEATSQPQALENKDFHPVSLPALMQKEYNGSDLKLGTVEMDNDSYTRYQISYKSGDLTISGIMNIPKGDGPFPLLILNHGHIDTSIYTIGRGLRREQDYLARQGFAVLHTDYRNHAFSDDDPNSELNVRLGYVEDSINAVYAVRNSNLPEIAKVDSEKVGMLGHSMGGGVTQGVIVVQPDLVDAAVLYAPVSSDYRDSFKRWIERRRPIADEILKTYGSPDENPEFWDNISPKTFFDRVQVPVMIFHGTSDSSVPYDWSTRLENELKDREKEVTLVTFQGEAHEFGPQWTTFMQKTTEFFKSNLK